MAETAFQAIIGKLVEYLVDAIKTQGSYLCCYSCNVARLADEVGKLNVSYDSLQQRVGAARANNEDIPPDVVSWLNGVEAVQSRSQSISDVDEEVRKRCLSKWFPVLHYTLSRESVKTAQDAMDLQKTTFNQISIPRILAEYDPIPASSVVGFKSRDSTEDRIMDALKDESVYLIGIWGIGGVGKTTMAKKIVKRVRGDKSMFEHVVMATVSQQPDLQKLQRQIAKALGLHLNEEESLDDGAIKLHERLKAEKGILIILDDLWESLDLEGLGIPSQSTHAGCKLFLTSRNEEAIPHTVNPAISKKFHLEVLTEEESWNLFSGKAGIADGSHLIEIAKDVAKECGGLPLALITVSCALKGKEKSFWDNALRELKISAPNNIPNVLKKVYQPLMLSISELQSNDQRDLFLLCCLFPEDYEISLEELVRCGMRLRIFEGLKNLEEFRGKVETVLGILISRSLLIKSSDDWGNLYVKMHDVIRDVGIWIASEKKIESEGKIASKEKHVFMVSRGKDEWPTTEEDSYGNYTCISLQFSRADIAIPEFIACPRLEYLRMGLSKSWWSDFLKIPEEFFSRMRSLKVLEAFDIGSLPSSVGLLKNLRTLHLSKCRRNLKTASVIGNLVNLEILILNDCEIKVLPAEIGGLKKLRQLDISWCGSLRRIAFGVISGLRKLEELVVVGSFKDWEAEAEGKENGNGITNACLDELDRLNNLTTLRIEISDPDVIPRDKPQWAQKVKKYSIALGVSNVGLNDKLAAGLGRFDKALQFGRSVKTPLADWLYEMTSDAEYLKLEQNSCKMVVDRLSPSRYRNCLKLSIGRCNNVKYLAKDQQNGAIFPILKSLRIEQSSSLQEISNFPPPAESFDTLEEIELRYLFELERLWASPTTKLCLSNLKKIDIRGCPRLLYLFSLSIAQSLSQLEQLQVSRCGKMEEIFKNEDEGMEINKIEFPKLHLLELENSEHLCGLSKGVDIIEVPALRHLKLNFLESFLIDQQFAGKNSFNFSSLQILEVERIHSFRCFLSPSGFPELKKLEVRDCSELVIRRKEIVGEKESMKTLFPSFTFLSGEFADNSFSFNFSGLKILKVSGVHNFRCMFSPSILSGFPNLEKLEVKDCSELEEVIGKDANTGETTLFPKLKRLCLSHLPKILTFCYSGIKGPSLETLDIGKCPMMERFSRRLLDMSNSRFNPPFFNEEVYCPKLRYLNLEGLNTAGIFSPPSFRALTNLRRLVLEGCKELEEVIANEEVEVKGPTNDVKEILSPQLECVVLNRLPKMHRFCYMKHVLEFPSLEGALIRNCPKLERFSLGRLHLPNLKRIDGLQDADCANKIFFHKEISSHQIRSEKNCFNISARDLSIKVPLKWFVARDSSGSFVDAVLLDSGRSIEIAGKFETTKLPAGIEYEITFVIMFEKDEPEWKELVELELRLPGGITIHREEILDKQPKDEWIEITVGKFTREPNQIGSLEFSLYHLKKGIVFFGPSIKGATIREVKA